MNRTQALNLAIRAIQFMIARYPIETAHYYDEDTPQYQAALQLCSQLAQAENLIKKEIEANSFYPKVVQ